jgi:hypothetical protein
MILAMLFDITNCIIMESVIDGEKNGSWNDSN